MELSMFKIGDKIILKKSNNDGKTFENKILTIVGRLSNYYSCKCKDGQSVNVFLSGPADDFCLADRKEHAKYLREQIDMKRKEINSLLKEAEELERFETEEDALADKLIKLINAKDVNAVAKILKEMKRSDYL